MKLPDSRPFPYDKHLDTACASVFRKTYRKPYFLKYIRPYIYIYIHTYIHMRQSMVILFWSAGGVDGTQWVPPRQIVSWSMTTGCSDVVFLSGMILSHGYYFHLADHCWCCIMYYHRGITFTVNAFAIGFRKYFATGWSHPEFDSEQK